MKVISIEAGRTTWLFPVEEFMPLEGADGKKIIADITSRYGFTHPPANPTREDIDKNGLKFSGGILRLSGEIQNIAEFIVYNDGIVASANTTEGAGAFLDDLIGFLITEHSFRDISSPIKKVDLSTVVIEFHSALSAVFSGYDTIATAVAEQLNSPEQTNYPADLMRIDFVLNRDPEFRPQNLPRLTIEKRPNTLFSQHRYFSSAPIPTKKHLALLERIEMGFHKSHA